MSDARENLGYRRGVVLGLTIAEIIILIMFALLLAMTAVLVKRQKATIAAVETRMAGKQLPQTVIEKLSEMKINLAQKDGELQIMAILNAADVDPTRQKEQQKTYQLGSDVQQTFGKEITADKLLKTQNDLKSQLESNKAEQGKILPPCYQSKKGDPIPFVFDLYVRNETLVLRDSAPETLRDRFKNDFGNSPSAISFSSDRDFLTKVRPYADFGKKHQCKFYVKVYDETGGNKERLKSQLKIIESTFVWTFMMSGKSNDDVNLFPVAPNQLK